ncbi:Myosin-I heavy chain [Diplonema papillatum]|nr:Myosin-I heavy chain [Diplonema papillatum]
MASKELFRPGESAFYVNPTTGWAIGTIKGYAKGASGKPDKIEVDDNGETFAVAINDAHPHTEGSYDKRFDDLFQMGDLHQSTLLFCLKARYEQSGMMFTRMGEIIISVNPFEFKPYNSPEAMAKHTEGKWDHPHTWEVAHKAYKKIIVMDRNNQSILISGESGAGKTETAKTLIDYLGQMSYAHSCNAVQKQLADEVNKKLKASNPILESFGNAKTLRNDNSSRFGKYIKLFFDKDSGVLMGAQMIHYLLEKSRIVTQNEGERGYHVFYELLAGATPEMKAKYGGLTKAEDYECLSKGGQFIREMNGRVTDDKEEFVSLLKAFKDTGITDAEQNSIFSILAAILHLQNVKFETDEKTLKAKIVNKENVTKVSKLLNVDEAQFADSILVKNRTALTGSTYADVPEAMDMRDALSKGLYSGVFSWLVAKLNHVIQPDERSKTKKLRYIGLLDIFGFENFKINSFEQFCINFTNESLQNHYNKYTFIQDAEECTAEGIACPIVEYPDNQPCLDMLQGSGGVMQLLDQQSAFKLATDGSFTELAWEKHGKHDRFTQPKSTTPDRFGIKHYAADVTYMTQGWLEKNSDTLKDEMRECVNASSDSLVAGLLGPVVEEKGGKKKPTVASKFKQQLDELKEELQSTDSHFIRTVKPNPQMRAGRIDNAYVMTQLTCAGVIETIIMKRQGYPVRQEHKDFWLRYRIVAPKKVRQRFPSGTHPSAEDLPGVCREIAEHWCFVLSSPKPNFDIGHTKVFTKSKVNEGLEIARHKKVSRLLPRCVPYLLRWIQAYKQKKAEIEEARRKAQEEIKNAKKHSTADIKSAAAGQTDEKSAIFTEMSKLFPHFDLPVILNVVENAKTAQQVTNFLLDMQKQRVSDALPVTVKTIFDEAKLRDSTQEALIERGVTDREEVFKLTSEQMEECGFSVEERDNLAGVLLSQQSNWIVNQRLSLLMGAEGRDEGEIAEDLARLEAYAIEIKKDLEGHLAGKYKNVTVKGSFKKPVTKDQIERFMAMGFSRAKAEEALKKAGGDAAKACDLLLTGGQ